MSKREGLIEPRPPKKEELELFVESIEQLRPKLREKQEAVLTRKPTRLPQQTIFGREEGVVYIDETEIHSDEVVPIELPNGEMVVAPRTKYGVKITEKGQLPYAREHGGSLYYKVEKDFSVATDDITEEMHFTLEEQHSVSDNPSRSWRGPLALPTTDMDAIGHDHARDIEIATGNELTVYLEAMNVINMINKGLGLKAE